MCKNSKKTKTTTCTVYQKQTKGHTNLGNLTANVNTAANTDNSLYHISRVSVFWLIHFINPKNYTLKVSVLLAVLVNVVTWPYKFYTKLREERVLMKVQHFLWSLQCHRTSTAHSGSTVHQIMLIFSYQVSHKHISLAPTCFGHNQPSSEWLLFNDDQNHSILFNYIKHIKNTSVLIYVCTILVNLKLISKPVAHLLINLECKVKKCVT